MNENQHFRESKHIFIPENNLGMESAHLDSMVADIPGVETFWEKDNRPGVCKDGKATRGYQFMLTNCLAQGSLWFDRDLFTTTREKTPACMKDLLADQMYRYGVVVVLTFHFLTSNKIPLGMLKTLFCVRFSHSHRRKKRPQT